MRPQVIVCAMLIACTAGTIRSQQATETRVPLLESAIAVDAEGRAALAGRLRTTDLRGALDSPVTNIRLVIENRSELFYLYISGWATFYDTEGVRCGEGLFKLDALASGEAAETDTPGLRLRCAPVSWRIVATNLLTRSSNTAMPNQPMTEPLAAPVVGDATTVPLLEIDIDGDTLPLQLGNPIEINTSRKTRMRIVVNARLR